MSNIIVRNIIGNGVFAVPSNNEELTAATQAFADILNGIADFTCETCVAQIVDISPNSQELTMISDLFTYDGSWFTTDIGLLRVTLQTALTDHANILGIGTVDINIVKPKPLYTYVPQVTRIDNRNGVIYFKNDTPPGAQLEVYQFARKNYNDTHGPYTRKGKRWRPSQLLPVGARSFNANNLQKHNARGRTHFRFAFRWPAPPGSTTPAPGNRGPLSAFTISSATPWERANGTRIVIVASPSSFGNTNS